MNPFTAVLGFITGSLVSLAFGLGVVLLVFAVLRGDHPRFAAELPEVARGFALFLVLATIACCGFFGTLRQARWRHGVLVLMWCGLALAGWYYWPG
jgi:Na+-translocating ferredoxin:NAD+ oxidoreductase RnfA subunit